MTKKVITPVYNPKFKQWQITWNNPDGSYGGVWADTKEECLKEYKQVKDKENKK